LIRRALVVPLAVAAAVAPAARAQQAVVSGQASGWVTSKPDTSIVSQAGLRYIPELAVQDTLGGDLAAALDLSADGFVTGSYGRGAAARYDATLKPYRAWLRVATHAFEARIGLQKINFGSAMLFRPLMWFDRVDPRDPLQLTAGVTGALARYTFADNTNLWGWALLGNTAPKGWETAPTRRGTVEVGGRVQTAVPAGEVGVTYHHREADLRSFVAGAVVPEDRLGVDGKWNLGVGLWGEAALVHQATDSAPTRYQRFWTVGADYTVGVGNGLYLLAEFSRFDTPRSPLGPGAGAAFSGLELNYPVGIVDRVTAIVYRNWQANQWFRIVTWQRSYDAWTLYLLGFWNPDQPQGLESQLGGTTFAGRGLQLVVAFNH